MAERSLSGSSQNRSESPESVYHSLSDISLDSSSSPDGTPAASPRKRRRHRYDLMNFRASDTNRSAAWWSPPRHRHSNRQEFERDRRPSDSYAIGSEGSEWEYDPTAQMSDTNDLQRLVSVTNAPSVASLYRKDPSEPESGRYECTPLYCFYPRSSGTNRRPTVDHFELGMEIDRPSRDSSSLTDDSRPLSQGDGSELPDLDHVHTRGRRSYNPSDFISFSQPYGQCPIDLDRIPVEVFELIAQYLSLHDVQSMRLTNKAFERGVSGHLFENVVVPFRTDIYGALAAKAEPGLEAVGDRKGKGRATKGATTDRKLEAAMRQQKAQLDVFRGFGPHIKRFGISFAVGEAELTTAKPKEVHQGEEAYWGKYRWPFPEYPRFEDRAGLESTADETSTMRHALRHLSKVRHLALSIDSGLGWLSGPDLSIRSRVLRESRHPFAKYKQAMEPGIQSRRAFWKLLQGAYDAAQDKESLKKAEFVRYEKSTVGQMVPWTAPQAGFLLDQRLVSGAVKDNLKVIQKPLKNEDVFQRYLHETEPRLPVGVTSTISNLARLPSQNGPSRYIGGQSRIQAHGVPDGLLDGAPVIQADPAQLAKFWTTGRSWVRKAGVPPPDKARRSPETGILYTRPIQTEDDVSGSDRKELVPNQLTQSQREWLMETAWAQDAFLSSYMISVADNTTALMSVATLTLSPFSSCHLTKLLRSDFWSSLPSLRQVDLLVSPDWRTIERHQAGYTSSQALAPSKALDALYYVLDLMIAPNKKIDQISLGWASGGEHAEGLHARNRHLLPAPISDRQSALLQGDFGLPLLNLPHIRTMKLINCWVAPNVLQDWVRRHVSASLCHLTLESVSLIAHPKIPSQGANGAAAAAVAAVAAGGGAGLQQPGGNLFNQMIQQFQQHMQNNVPAGPNQMPTVAQMQAHLQQLVPNVANPGPGNIPNNAIFNGNVGAIVNAAPNAPLQQNQTAQATEPREGSWPVVLGRIQDCATLCQKHLEVTFASCGYALLTRANFDQSEIELGYVSSVHSDSMQERQTQAWFQQRRTAIGHAMMQSHDHLFGRVVSWLANHDVESLEGVWNLRRGWPDSDVVDEDYDDEGGWGKWGQRTKEAAAFDGEQPGGCGRFSGRITFSPKVETDD